MKGQRPMLFARAHAAHIPRSKIQRAWDPCIPTNVFTIIMDCSLESGRSAKTQDSVPCANDAIMIIAAATMMHAPLIFASER